MEHTSDTKLLNAIQQEKLKALRAELEKIDTNMKSDKKHFVEDGALISNIGWISISSLTIATLAMGGFGGVL
ncbi:MAG TPA: hypothetical protein VMJ33_00295 [Gallionella sp.]|nr:hypothetical protein [Gallionella sp.]